MEAAKLKKFITAILWFFFFMTVNWYLIGSRNALEYKEYIEIVKAIEDVKLDSECIIDLKVETDSPWGWTPARMDLSITKGEVSVATSTSKFFKPDRIEQSPGTFYHYFHWSVDTSEGLVASYLELEMSSGKKLNWIKVGECSAISRNDYFSNTYEGCKNREHRAVKCS